ncbi:hypothetical protein MKZ38_001965 [Zalerion maritima]|uniref:Uncharacterized protein n=1 Tax=Zalerion maritima TaxID=339359 RepID=A0AAD5WTF3_9PEZI|nr:hypothetical protein MKZ38_001965 [Zalerion maritima]
MYKMERDRDGTVCSISQSIDNGKYKITPSKRGGGQSHGEGETPKINTARACQVKVASSGKHQKSPCSEKLGFLFGEKAKSSGRRPATIISAGEPQLHILLHSPSQVYQEVPVRQAIPKGTVTVR